MQNHQFQQGPNETKETWDSLNFGFKLITNIHHQHGHIIELQIYTRYSTTSTNGSISWSIVVVKIANPQFQQRPNENNETCDSPTFGLKLITEIHQHDHTVENQVCTRYNSTLTI